MIFSMFLVLGNLVIKFLLWLATEEVEVIGAFYGDESFGEAGSHMQQYLINFFFSQLPFAVTIIIIAFHVYSIIQERTNELYFFVGDSQYMMQVIKFLIFASIVNLVLLVGAYNI